ncbi:MAG: LysM peptidoglycan-binding domain-containing protein [Verrucomicrobiales bacterium]
MKQDQRTQKRPTRTDGLLHKIFSKPKRLPATAVQEHDWDSDVPSIKLSTAFMVILFLHVAVVGGVMLFRFLEKDSDKAFAGADAGTQRSSQDAAPVPGEGIRQDDPALAGLPRHLVRPHETLDMIASMHGVSRDALSRANRLNADNPFREGMNLVIPPAEANAAPQGNNTGVAATRPGAPVPVARAVEVPVPAPAVPVTTGGETRVARAVAVESGTTPAIATRVEAPARGGQDEHVVKAGETLWAISQRYGVSVDNLLKANGITNANRVRQGTKLTIPGRN